MAEPVTGPGETTTHFSVVDKWGNLVTYTNTIESSHGIGVFAGYKHPTASFNNLGFLLNNELTDFNTAPSTNPYTGSAGLQRRAAQQAPAQQHDPTMIFTPDGQPLVAFGSPGGATIINSVLNVTLNLIDHKMTIQDAINAPRMSVTGTAHHGVGRPGLSRRRRSTCCARSATPYRRRPTSARCRRWWSTRRRASSTAAPTRAAKAR